MKLNLFETHDRLLKFKKEQSNTIQQGCDDCLKRNPLSIQLQDKSPYIYIFAHPRTVEYDEKVDYLLNADGVTPDTKPPSQRMLWQPRLTRPEAQTNSYLFRVQSHTDILEICWMLPPVEMWSQYKQGLIAENQIVLWSINQFMNNKEHLEFPHSEDLPDVRVRQIMAQIIFEKNQEKMMKGIYPLI